MVRLYFNIVFFLFLTQSILCQENSFYRVKGGSEIGFSFGTLWIGGDLKSQWSDGISNAIHWRKGINNVWSIKLALQHGQAYGMDFMPTYDLESIYPDIFQGYDHDNPYFFAYKTNYSSIEFSNLFELTNLAPEVYLKNWNVYLGVGIGIANFKTNLDLKNNDGEIYSDLISKTEFSTINDYNTVAGRKNILNSLYDIYDHEYETPGPKKEGQFRLGDETNIQAHLLFNVGVSRKINNRVNLGLEYSARFSNNDLLDGYDKSVNLKSSGNDVIHSVNFVLGFNLGKSHNTKPLYWNNPFSAMEKLILDQQLKSDSLFLDDDQDGVANGFDEQVNSMANCPVDAKGVTLDSDQDGKPDCIDPNPYMNEQMLQEYLKEMLESYKGDTSKSLTPDTVTVSSNYSFEEMEKAVLISQLSKPVYFELNSSDLDHDAKKHLLEVSKVLKRYPELKIKLDGHADRVGSDNHNNQLSEKRVKSVMLFMKNILNVTNLFEMNKWHGESNPIITDSEDSNHFLNRRVEINIVE